MIRLLIKDEYNELFRNPKDRDPMIGKVFNRLMVLKYEECDKNGRRQYLCECVCGNMKIISKHNLKDNGTQSCGCLQLERLRKSKITHSMYKTPTYKNWLCMKERCYNTNKDNYNEYGGRGITICDEWLYDFKAFYDYIGQRPYKEYTLDRIDNDGNYEPGNVRWADKSEQSRNHRLHKDNISGYNGIRAKQRNGYITYEVSIINNYKYIYIGTYKSHKIAIANRQNAEFKYWKNIYTKYPIKIFV